MENKYEQLLEYLKERKRDLMNLKRRKEGLTPSGKGMLMIILAVEQKIGIKL
ncbi:MAG: hypothetical protein PHV82_11645 [Victivallaceae bacterium]|nr:hypothetical protein [Victivallaceae bacterium]